MWLVGMMGVGKTSIGQSAAAVLEVPFYDTDWMIVEMAGKPIAEIWAELGEPHFRALERQAVSTVPEGCLAAAGGGAILERENRDHMRRNAPVVWLDSKPSVLASRVGGDAARPLAGDASSAAETLSSILEHRRRFYAEAATHVIEADDRPMEDLVSEVVALWPR